MFKIKKVANIALTFCFLLSSCYVTKTVLDNQNQLTDNLVFEINLIEEGNSISQGGNSFSRPKKGDKFVFIHLTVQNNSDKTEKLDFNNFYLLDTVNKTKRKLESVMLTTAVNLWGSSDSSIKGNSKKSRKLVFTFPKEQVPSLMLVNDNAISIPYSK